MGQWCAIGPGEFDICLILRILTMARHRSRFLLSRQCEHLSHAPSIGLNVRRGEATQPRHLARRTTAKKTHENASHFRPHRPGKVKVLSDTALRQCSEPHSAKSTARAFRQSLHISQHSITVHAIVRLTHADQICARTHSPSIG